MRSELNELLSDKSYVGGGGHATAEDVARFKELTQRDELTQRLAPPMYMYHIKYAR